MKRKTLLSKVMLLLCILTAGVSSAWGVEYSTITTFRSDDVVSNSTYKAYSNNYWSVTFGGNNKSLGSNSGNSSSCKITQNYGTSASTSNIATAVISKTTISNVSRITFSYSGGSGNSGKIYLGYSTNGSTWNAISLTSGTQGSSATTSMTFDFEQIPSAYYAIILDKGNSTTGNFRWDNVVVTFSKPTVVPISSISLDQTSASVGVGGSVTLTPTLTPATATETVVWESDNTDIATVSNGVVTGVAVGSTTIRAKSPSDDSIKAECEVTVTAAVPVTGISLNKTSTTLFDGGTETLTATISPANASNKNVTWESSKETVATVVDGVLTAVGVGTAIVTATTVDGGYTATCEVTVNPVVVTGVTLNKTSTTIMVEANETLTATVAPANATNKTVNWTTSDPDIATVTSAGVVTGVAAGTATITATTVDGSYTATCTVTVSDGSIVLTTPGQTLSFTDFSGAGSGYSNGAEKNISFTGSDGNKYAWPGKNYCSQQGLQLKSSGSDITSPTVRAPYGYKMTLTHSNGVNVYVGSTLQTPVATKTYILPTNTAVTLKPSSGTPVITNITFKALKPSRTITFEKTGDQEVTVDANITNAATATPTGTVTYSSSNTEVATVNATTGEVTGIKSGAAVITATVAEDEDYEKSTASYSITVNKAATTLTFANAEETVELVEGTVTFTATATPNDGSRTITYSSDDAAVNASTGAVTLTETGDFTIKANATVTDKYLAPVEASYTLHVVDSRVPVVDAASVTLILTDGESNPIALNNVPMGEIGTLASTYTKATGFTGSEAVTFTSSDATVLNIDDDTFEALKGGNITVTVTITSGGEKMFSTVEKEFAVTVINASKTSNEISIMDEDTNIYNDGDELNLTYGTPMTLDVSATTGYEGAIVNALSNTNIVSVNVEGTTVTITPTAVGSTTLTFSAAETANYTAASDITLTVNVTEVAGKTTAESVEGTVEDLDFSEYYVPDTWEMTTTNAGSYQAWTNNEDNNFISANGYNSGTRYAGTYDYITDEYDLTNYISANLIFSHAGQYFGGSISDGVKLYALVDGVEQPLTINNYFAGNSYSSYVTNTTNINSLCGKTTKIIFRYISDGTNANTGRWDIKDFKITGEKLPSAAVTVAASGYASYCYEYPLNLDLLDENVKAYTVTKVEGKNVTFTQITGTIKGGVPFILYGEAGEHTLYTATSSDVVPAGNLLKGTLAPTYISTEEGDYTNFGLNAGSFKKINNGVLPAHKAYLPIETSKLPAGEARMNIVFEDAETTGIENLTPALSQGEGAFYDLQGRKVNAPKKGLYIVNGKKLFVK